MVEKLMMKAAEDRYQTATGLLWDLRQLQEKPNREFRIGKQDFANNLVLPYKIYGRDMELRILTGVFEEVCRTGVPKVLVVGGFSGIGKSAFVNEIHQLIAFANGRYMTGKFEQASRNVAYSALIQAFSDFTKHILGQNEDEIAEWKRSLLEAVGGYGQLMIDLIPELQLVIGPQPAVPILEGISSRKRFEAVFQKFFLAFVPKEKPLVLFLDDLQWADPASLELIKVVLDSDIKYVFLLGAYRDNEVDEHHPAITTLQDIQKMGISVQTVVLPSLGSSVVQEWLSDALNCSQDEVKPLSDFVYRNTQGNPFFMKMYVRSLVEEKLLTLNEKHKWVWDLEKISKTQAMENVVQFLVKKIGQLSESARSILAHASCLGNHFSMEDLAIITGIPIEELSVELHAICNAGMTHFIEDTVYFAHDRVEEASYSLLSNEEKMKTHILIANLFLRHYPVDKFPEKLFDIVDHLNEGAPMTTEPAEVERLIRLNTAAGMRAKAASGYNSALNYINHAIHHLNSDSCWSERYDTTFSLYKEKAELEYLSGNFAQSEQTIFMILSHAKSPTQKASVYTHLIRQKTVTSQYFEAIRYGQIALSLLGYDIPDDKDQCKIKVDEQFAEISATMKSMGNPLNILKMSEMSDPSQRAVSEILADMLAPAFLSNRPQYELLCSLAANLILTYGPTSDTGLTFGFFGSLLAGNITNSRLGFDISELAVKLADRYGLPDQQCKVYHTTSILCSHWFMPLRATESRVQTAFMKAQECGEWQYGCYSRYHLSILLWQYGHPLQELAAEGFRCLYFCRKNKSVMARRIVEAILCAAKRLAKDIDLITAEVDESKLFEELQTDPYPMSIYRCTRSWTAYISGDIEEALVQAEEARKLSVALDSHYLWSRQQFQESLILIAAYPDASAENRTLYQNRIKENLDNLRVWSSNCPENFEHMHLLVSAELARIKSDFWNASILYEKAIKASQHNAFLQDEALAKELTGKFWLTHGNEQMAALRLRDAISIYRRWDAKDKANALFNQYRMTIMVTDESSSSSSAGSVPQTTMVASSVLMDMQNVIKASQMISSDIEMERLLFSTMNIIAEIAGIEKGALFLLNEGKLSVDAEYEAGQVQVLQESDAKIWKGAHTVVEYVRNTKKSAMIGHAAEDKQFCSDPYIQKKQVKSLLVMPIMKQDELKGILYLENNLATFAFHNNRVVTLTVLTSQLAISIENARLMKHQTEVLNRIKEEQKNRERYQRKLEEFIDTICHELRNPLNGIYGGATLLVDRMKNLQAIANDLPQNLKDRMQVQLDGVAENVETINKCAQQQKVIVDDVLDLSRIESNKIEMNPSNLQVRGLFTSIIQMLSPQINLSKLKLITELPDDNIWVRVDPHRLSQIVMNLLSNALKFTETGFIEIVAKVTPLRIKPQAEMSVSVRDSGIGMSIEEMRVLFERFSQATPAISTKYGGSGLGLVISKKLVERMGGEITVQSKKEVGSTFSFTIRCELAERQEQTDEERTDVSAAPSNLAILIVEDNMMNQRVLLNYCNQQGHLITVANDGLQAIQKYSSMNFDLIFMDCEMPIMDGLTATKRIREIEAQLGRSRTPIIGLSGNARATQIEEGKKVGMDDYLTKPFHRDDLYRVISAHARPQNSAKNNHHPT
eukprot:TRINITY_DN2652_c1_g1_i3.p1 TRINITY_DN2652_c1_g1~~TRINITY_DN2652_c1_g1_i3.p1  ORF type:complete len:1641 (+),score=348.00 TRINITY_DN2652_c1_g1_i3:2383-7305(+)